MPAPQHHRAPVGRGKVVGVDDALFGQQLQDTGKGDAGLDFLDPVEHREIGGIGKDQTVIGVEEGKSVLDGFHRLTQPAFGDLEVFGGAGEVGFHPLVLVAHRGHFGALFDDLLAQRAGMMAKLAIGGKKLGLLELEQALRRKAGAAFLGKFAGESHRPAPVVLRLIGGTLAARGEDLFKPRRERQLTQH